METDTQYDVAIIGSGIAGSTLGAILARNGLKVIIFESKSHPKFAIGESMILETSETLRAMAEIYSVPELAFFSSENYFSHIGTSHGVKRHFSYLYHTENKEQNPQQSLQAVIPKQPYGHELHLHRQDTDYFLMTVAVHYGVRVLQNTEVENVNITAAGVKIITDKSDRFHAEYVVDAGGFRSPLANKFNLRNLNLQTHSRAIFTHMIDVPCYHKVGASQQEYGIPFRVSEGTLHHLFKGGWLWVIPFNNHSQGTNPLCSVGLMLDPRIHPPRQNLSPEAEFYSFIRQFPSIQSQFRDAKAIRDWTRTNRIQYSSKQIVGDRFCLLGHGAGFIDPLFSKGLYTSLMSVSVVANLLIDANQTKDYSTPQFRVLEDITLAFIHSNDRLIANAYKSFSNYELWSVYSILWLLGAYLELLKLTSIRAQSYTRHEYYSQIKELALVGGAFDEFDALANKIYDIVENTNVDVENEVKKAVSQIKALYQNITWLPHAFMEIVKGKNHLPVNKLKPTLLKRQGGFLGVGSYRQYFFSNLSVSFLIKFFLREKAKHSFLKR